MVSKFAAAPYLLPTLAVEVCAVLLAFHRWQQRQSVIEESEEPLLGDESRSQIPSQSAVLMPFLRCSGSRLGRPRLLLLTRVLSLGLYGGVGVCWGLGVVFPHSWNFFTLWNVTLIAAYFLGVTAASAVRCFSPQLLERAHENWLL